MADENEQDFLSDFRAFLEPHLESSAPLRRAVRRLGQWLIEAAQQAEESGGRPRRVGASTEPVAPAVDAGDEPHAESIAGEAHEQAGTRTRATVPLKLGDAAAQVSVTGTSDEIDRAESAADDTQATSASTVPRNGKGEGEIDLAVIEQRCRLKAASCRIMIERSAVSGDPDAERSIIDSIDEMIGKAKALPGCFLWVFWRERTQPESETIRRIAACYDALARGVSLMQQVEQLGDRVAEGHLRQAMQLLAEADSALRVALEPTWLAAPDVDQDEVHQWLRRESSRHGIYVPRHMKLDDPADPDRAAEIIVRADEIAAECDAHARRIKEIDEIFKMIRYHARLIDHLDASADRYHYEKIAEGVAGLCDLGLAPTDRRFREVVDPSVASSFPRECAPPGSVEQVIEHVKAWHDRRLAVDESVVVTAREMRRWSAQVQEVRELLAGRTVVLIGGEPRADAADRITEAFDLDECIWVRLTEHASGEPMRAPISRPETALVLVLVKLAGHLRTEEASGYAQDVGKPCVYLKAGYNPEQIADSILQQASEQLRQLHAAQ